MPGVIQKDRRQGMPGVIQEVGDAWCNTGGRRQGMPGVIQAGGKGCLAEQVRPRRTGSRR